MFTFPTDRTAVMGILNITPDSFSDGGKYQMIDNAVARAEQMVKEGAAVIDIGAQSTRPGAVSITDEQEWQRLEPVLQALNGQLSVPLSVDTFSPYVATRASAYGIAVLNDVSGSMTNDFPAFCAAGDLSLIMMARDAACPTDVRRYFENALETAARVGLPYDRLCLDIGIGFHNSRDTDLEILKALPQILCGLPRVAVLCGASRKRVIAHAAGDCPTAERLGGTVALHTIAQLGGATVLRVHDVKEAVQAAAVTDAVLFARG